MTSDLYQKWKGSSEEPVQIHSKGSLFSTIALPDLASDAEPEIFGDSRGHAEKVSHLSVWPERCYR